MKFEIKKNLIKHELGDLAKLVEATENDITLSDLSFNDRLEHFVGRTYYGTGK